jgi:hypothetical protein
MGGCRGREPALIPMFLPGCRPMWSRDDNGARTKRGKGKGKETREGTREEEEANSEPEPIA